MTGIAAHAANPARGIALMVMAVLLFTVMDGVAKYLGERGYSTWQLIFCRSFFAMLPVLLFVRREGGFRVLRTRRPLAHLGRCALGVSSLFCFFYSFKLIPLADAMALSFSAPLFVTALSVPLLGERVGPHRWAAVAAGFVGVLIMVQPGSDLFQPVALLVLLSAVLYAFAIVLVRSMSGTEASITVVFYFSISGIAVGSVTMPFAYTPPHDLTDAALMVSLGLLGGCAQFLMTNAYRHADAAVIAPFDYTAILWAVVIGLVVFGDWPAPSVFLGVAVVIASGLYILHRETRRTRLR